jgi:Uma2 family endonuclease
MPHLHKAELIDGVVHMPSPVSYQGHGSPHFEVNGWLAFYSWQTPGVQGANNATVRLDLENEPQPDLVLLIDPARGGQARISADDYLESAPELVVEISSSTAHIDLNRKLELYRRNRVQEYVVWRVPEQALDWFVLQDNQFQRLHPDEAGILRSETFPGLWLHVHALIHRDGSLLLATLQQGLASPEHDAFVAKLASALPG